MSTDLAIIILYVAPLWIGVIISLVLLTRQWYNRNKKPDKKPVSLWRPPEHEPDYTKDKQ